MPVTYSGFKSFMENLAGYQDTVKFWYHFMSEDCFAYIGLFVALRFRNWELRNGSIKQLAAIFSAFDRPTYQELIPHHLKDLLTLPNSVLHHLRKGGFSVRLTSSEWHGVALDECHEMRINKDAKLAVVRPSKQRMEFLSNYMAFRAACMENLQNQIFPERQTDTNKFSDTPSNKDKKVEANIQNMLIAISENGLFTDIHVNYGLWNVFEKRQANPEQAHDLLTFRTTGQKAFEAMISKKFLNIPSTNAPERRKRLCTFSVSKSQKRKVKLAEQERKISQRYLKRQLAWISKQGAENLDFDSLLGPVSSTPKALVDKDGFPYKAAKSNTTGFIQKRYKQIPVVLQSLPVQWIPDSVILEGMFLIQTNPIPTMNYMQQYVQLLMNQFVAPHFKAGVQEVHVVFDSPGSMAETPKELEQKRRDKSANQESGHECTEFQSSTEIPAKWRSLLACRSCKERLILYTASEMISLASGILSSEQEFICNSAQTAHSVTSNGEKQLCPSLWSNTEEADLRVWLHCVHSAGTKKLIFSPDTDVYHVGLTVASSIPSCHMIVQFSRSYKEGAKFLDINNLLQALQNDPDLHGIPCQLRPQALHSLYVCTGCDYISFFVGMGKVSFLTTFYQYASFIAGGTDPPGSIGEVNLDPDSPALLSFFRLVGCAYFRAHASAFELPSPVSLYHSIAAQTDMEHHDKWLGIIRQTVWLRADTDSHNMPSTQALRLHWMRCTWVNGMWASATQNEIDMPGK